MNISNVQRHFSYRQMTLARTTASLSANVTHSLRQRAELDTIQKIRFGQTPQIQPKSVLSLPFIRALEKVRRLPMSRASWFHGLKMAAYLLDSGGNETQIISGLVIGATSHLSQPLSLRYLQHNFGSGVAGLVTQVNAVKSMTKVSHPVFQLTQAEAQVIAAENMYQVQERLDQLHVLYHRPVMEEQPLEAVLNLEGTRKLVEHLHTHSPCALTRELYRSFEAMARFSVPMDFSPQQRAVDNKPILLGKRFSNAMADALAYHGHQFRKATGAPYFAHLLGVLAYVLKYGGSENTAIAALLHDAPEDQGGHGTWNILNRKYGHPVGQMLLDCTQPQFEQDKPIFIPYPIPQFDFSQPGMDDWYAGKRGYIHHINSIKNPGALLVIAADKLDNQRALMRSVHEQGEDVWKSFWKGKNEQLWFLHAVFEALQNRCGFTPLVLLNKAQLVSLKRASFAKEGERYCTEKIQQHAAYTKLAEIARSQPETCWRISQPGEVPRYAFADPTRETLHQEIIESAFSEYLRSVGNQPGEKVAHIVTGLPASGKTTQLVNFIAKRDKAFIADADTIKERLPGYHLDPNDPQLEGLRVGERNGIGATAIHRESSMILDQLLEKVIENNHSFVISHAGRDVDWDFKFMKQLKEKGYRVYLHHVEVPPNAAVDRALLRYHLQGRFTPPSLIAGLEMQSTENYTKLRRLALKRDIIDGYSWSYNGVPKGDKPIVLEAHNTHPFL